MYKIEDAQIVIKINYTDIVPLDLASTHDLCIARIQYEDIESYEMCAAIRDELKDRDNE